MRIFFCEIALMARRFVLSTRNLHRVRKIFCDAISIRCFRLSVSNLIRAVDTRAVFAALPRVRARCGALRQAAPHFRTNLKSPLVRPARALRIDAAGKAQLSRHHHAGATRRGARRVAADRAGHGGLRAGRQRGEAGRARLRQYCAGRCRGESRDRRRIAVKIFGRSNGETTCPASWTRSVAR